MAMASWPLLRLLIKRPTRAIDNGWPVIWLWGLSGAGIMLIQAKGYDYHWLPMLPPLVLIAADSVDRLSEGTWRLLSAIARPLFSLNCRAWSSAVQGVVIAGLLLVLLLELWRPAWPYLSGRQSKLEYYSRFRGGEFVADESQRVVDYLRARTIRGDSLYIWGFRPEVYYLSGLNPATRFIFQFPLVAEWYPVEWQQENVDTLWAALPPYVLILQVDYMPWVTGSHEDSNTLLQSYTELNNWLIYNYERETQIGNFFVWRRKAEPG
jgi:hypothetical protein